MRYLSSGATTFPTSARCPFWGRQSQGNEELPHFARRQLDELPPLQLRWQPDRAEADPHEAADDKAQALEYPAQHAVSSFANHHVVPMVGTFATPVLQRLQARRTVFQRHAGAQL